MAEAFHNPIQCSTVNAGTYLHEIHVRQHVLRADVDAATGGADAAPDPHDYFDSALAACKAQTAMWYAKRHAIPLETVTTRVERDESDERGGHYRLRVQLEFGGAQLTGEQRARLRQVVEACPIHKLMTRTEIAIETVD